MIHSRKRGGSAAEPRGKSTPHAIRLGVIGLGTVGTGAVRVLLEHRQELERRLGCRLELKALCSRSIRERDLSWLKQPVTITTEWKDVTSDPEINIVVELVGGLPVARAIAHAAFAAGKHLVTANKQLLAEYGMELVDRSRA
ncbi:MAG: hypothetical protein ACRD06_04270, partial [Terriglobia bacterium]